MNVQNNIKTFTITSQPYYNQYQQQYRNILTVNIEPPGPLRRFVRRLRMPNLSPFYGYGSRNGYNNNHCSLAILSLRTMLYPNNQIAFYNNCGVELMSPDEIPDLISYLEANGYQIETQITNMLNQSQVKFENSKLAFTVTYYGKNQPNITYMR